MHVTKTALTTCLYTTILERNTDTFSYNSLLPQAILTDITQNSVQKRYWHNLYWLSLPSNISTVLNFLSLSIHNMDNCWQQEGSYVLLYDGFSRLSYHALQRGSLRDSYLVFAFIDRNQELAFSISRTRKDVWIFFSILWHTVSMDLIIRLTKVIE